MAKSELKILLAAPRGFCAGVDRAIQIVEMALEKYGRPIYVRHEIVHNRHVVDSLAAKGAIFVEELDEVPDNATVIFSAHGVPKSVPEAARQRNLRFVDATCPLVSKVHREAERHHSVNRQIVMIGHAGHPEVIGTMGQVPDDSMKLVESVEDVQALTKDDDRQLAYVTQTTLSVEDTEQIIDALRDRFPNLKEPRKEDICYATTNRQAAIKEIAPHCDALIVIGATNSSNSKRLVEVAKRSGCEKAILLRSADDIDWATFEGVRILGLSAGASAPEILVQEVVDAFETHFEVSQEVIRVADENLAFKLPPELREQAAE
jgi:4-hydroxy-3-methylbut-2-enyl diphosphate reductase